MQAVTDGREINLVNRRFEWCAIGGAPVFCIARQSTIQPNHTESRGCATIPARTRFNSM